MTAAYRSLTLAFGISLVPACAPATVGSQGASTSANLGATGDTPACSLDYWKWVLDVLEPQLARPSSEVSASDLDTLIEQAPDQGATNLTYDVCWSTIFDQYVFAPVVKQLHDASVSYVANQDYSALLAAEVPSPELVRNEAAIRALKPDGGTPTDVDTWAFSYDVVVGEVVAPVGLPGLYGYQNVVEAEWVVNAGEDRMLGFIEAARPSLSMDGGSSLWIRHFENLLTNGNPTMSYVFNLGDSYGRKGVEFGSDGPCLPQPVQSLLDRYTANRPDSIGPEDSASWMGLGAAYVLRLAGDAPQGSTSDAVRLDDVMLDAVGEGAPSEPMGLAAYKTWLSDWSIADVYGNADLNGRMTTWKPCVASSDGTAAKAAFDQAGIVDATQADGGKPVICD